MDLKDAGLVKPHFAFLFAHAEGRWMLQNAWINKKFYHIVILIVYLDSRYRNFTTKKKVNIAPDSWYVATDLANIFFSIPICKNVNSSLLFPQATVSLSYNELNMCYPFPPRPGVVFKLSSS